MSTPRLHGYRLARICVCVAAMAATLAAQDKFDSMQRARLHDQLRQGYEDISKNYYDPTFHGVDLQARYKKFDALLDTVSANDQGMGQIAEFVHGLDDSHTFYLPPARVYKVSHDFEMKIVGDTCYITHVRPGSDAATKLHPGDAVLTYNGHPVNRHTLWLLTYMYDFLKVSTSEELGIRAPDGVESVVTVQNKVKAGQHTYDLSYTGYDKNVWELVREGQNQDHLMRSQVVTMNGIAIWKLREFFAGPQELDEIYGKIRGHQTLILDLRGNGGGSVETLKDILGFLFEHDVTVAQRKGRKSFKPEIAKGRGQSAFPGKIFVLVDSQSASAAELLARVMQLEHRGTVLGDQTMGAVMESQHFREAEGADVKIFYGFSVTEADLIMSDGKSLEKVGVTPDQIFLPTASALATGTDPVLAQAMAMAGADISPKQAGALFPWEWAPE